MSNRTPRTSRPSREQLTDYHALELGCYRYIPGGMTVWRTIKRISQLLVITFGFWMGVGGTLSPQVAFAGMILVYFGAEGVESVLIEAGKASFSISREEDSDSDTDQERAKPDGGTIRVVENE